MSHAKKPSNVSLPKIKLVDSATSSPLNPLILPSEPFSTPQAKLNSSTPRKTLIDDKNGSQTTRASVHHTSNSQSFPKKVFESISDKIHKKTPLISKFIPDMLDYKTYNKIDLTLPTIRHSVKTDPDTDFSELGRPSTGSSKTARGYKDRIQLLNQNETRKIPLSKESYWSVEQLQLKKKFLEEFIATQKEQNGTGLHLKSKPKLYFCKIVRYSRT